MILVDTSVWTDHFRKLNARLVHLLQLNQVAIHPFVVGELACGNLPDRVETLRLLDSLPTAPVASDQEVRQMIEQRSFYGIGLGWVDMHLMASVLLLQNGQLWTLDRRLADAIPKG
ncbi:MAG: type II toxin-antitoxin system VapC family toxin [Rhodothermales bacterium]